MPCRPSPEEEAWAAAAAIEQLRQTASGFDRQRGVTIQLLRRLLRHAGLLQDFGQSVLAAIQTAPTTPLITGGDERATAKRQVRDAEVNLCVARYTLLQIVSLLPHQIVTPYAAGINAERSDHLRHRMDDCAAELAMLAGRITDLTGSDANAAELIRLRAEVERLRGMDPQLLLANRDFTAVVPCPRCGRALPMLPGLDPEALDLIAADLGTGNKIQAIKRLRDATRLGLALSKTYVECPHGISSPGPTAPLPPVETQPAQCRKCGMVMPPVPGVAPMLVNLLLVEVADKRSKEKAINLLHVASHWGLKESREYLECPHRTPGPR